MFNKSNEQLLIMQTTIESNRQESNEKMDKLIEYLKAMITSTVTEIMDYINISKPSTG